MTASSVSTTPSDWTELVSCIAGVGILLSDRAAPEPPARERALVAHEFPHLSWTFNAAATRRAALLGAVLVDEAEWHAGSTDLYDWDARVLPLQSRRGWLLVSSAHGAEPALEALLQLLTRYQRLVPRVNDASRGETFRCALSLHHSLHDLSKPLIRADYEHALDVWQWVLRLEPHAGLALQLAALFHDIERISSEGDQRIEQHATDYQAFKNTHAWIGAQLAAHTLEAAGVSARDSARAAELIWQHELPPTGEGGSSGRSDADMELRVLADADALSFFSLNSRGFVDYYGLEHTRKKVRYTLGRLSPSALGHLSHVKLPPEVERLVREQSRGAATNLQLGAS